LGDPSVNAEFRAFIKAEEESTTWIDMTIS
jgi:hypothetical protein